MFYNKYSHPRVCTQITHGKGPDGFIYHLLNVPSCSDAGDTFIPAPDYL